MKYSEKIIEQEAKRLFQKLKSLKWTLNDCRILAPLTFEINELKKKKDAVILAHSYQSPEIVYGVADFVGDSYGLSKIAAEHPAKTIVFCSVYFMGETAKILSSEKTVLVPSRAGCSLADSITAKNVEELRQSKCEKCKHFPSPKRCKSCPPVVCYVNTSAEVKAASDVCCTSSNVLHIIEALPEKEIIFIPDKYMADYIRRSTKKTIHDWPGRCIVHEQFTAAQITAVREEYPEVKVLVHPECSASVIDQADFVGSTSAIIDFIKKERDSSGKKPVASNTYMIVSECGLADRIRAENPEKTVVGTCSLCPYMKQIQLKDILTALKNPQEDQIVQIPEATLKKAKKSLDRMFELSAEKDAAKMTLAD